MEILTYIQAHWIEWVFACIAAAVSAIAAFGYRSVSSRLKKEKKRNDAIAEGMQALLRESIVDNFNKYAARDCCPIYAKESIKRVYNAYEKLGGNDVAEELYKKILAMPEEKGRKE